MAQHVSKNAKCPFYLKHEGTRIICEGVSEGNSLHLVFKESMERTKYIAEHCDNIHACQSCLIHKALFAKWRMG